MCSLAFRPTHTHRPSADQLTENLRKFKAQVVFLGSGGDSTDELALMEPPSSSYLTFAPSGSSHAPPFDAMPLFCLHALHPNNAPNKGLLVHPP